MSIVVSADIEAEPKGTAGTLTITKTSCRICMSFCGLDVTTDGEKIVRIRPDKEHPNNWRDFCIKGSSSGRVRDHPKRLTTPMKRVDDSYVAVSYDQAIKEIAAQLRGDRRWLSARDPARRDHDAWAGLRCIVSSRRARSPRLRGLC